LSEPDADRLGVRAGPNDPKVVLQTANGKVTGARVRLASIDIGGVRVQDVDAVILPGHALKQNLLGMSFLSRISRYEFRSGQLVLEQ
jgi:aspartyl protease family protein